MNKNNKNGDKNKITDYKSFKKNMKHAMEAAGEMRKAGREERSYNQNLCGERDEYNCDIGGSYTGTPFGGGIPEQDADDI